MSEEILDWYIGCDAETFAKCKDDPKFAYIVTLARSVNALNFVAGATPSPESMSSPANTRDRLNGYFIMCALFFEVLQLVEAMGKTFRDDALFRSGLQTLMEDKTAKRIRRMHLHPARNSAVFHFSPDHFAEKIKVQPPAKCLFLKARGKKKKDVYCTFAMGLQAARSLSVARIADKPTNLRCSYALQSTALRLTEPVLTVQFRLWGD